MLEQITDDGEINSFNVEKNFIICVCYGDKYRPVDILRNSCNCFLLVKKLPFINVNLSNFLKSS